MIVTIEPKGQNMLPPIIIDPKFFLYEHCSLPALPSILTEIQSLMNCGEVNFSEITELVLKDTALTAQVLKIANSAYYSLPVEVSRVKVAVAYLGINEIHRIVLSISIKNGLAGVEKELFNEVWSHSLHAALCAKNLANRYEPLLDTGEVWTVGLLHDIGKLVYIKFFPKHYKAISNLAEMKGCLFSEAEAEYSLPSSAYLGSLLCDRWRLPQRIKDSCMYHSLRDIHRLSENNNLENPYIRIGILSNLFSNLTMNVLNPDKQEEIEQVIGEILSLDKTNLQLLLCEQLELKDEAIKLI